MKCCYHSTINKFLNTSLSAWLNDMVSNYKQVSGFTPHYKSFNKQIDAWKNCYNSLHSTLKSFVIKNPVYGDLEIIFEYSIPKLRKGKLTYSLPYRADVIILSKFQATILEYKSAKKISSREINKDVAQLKKYISTLVEHHIEAGKMKIDGALIYTKDTHLCEYRGNYLVVSSRKFGKRITDLVNYDVKKHPKVIDWIDSKYVI